MAWLYKQPGSENWWLGYRLNGRQYRRSTATPDREQAERELEKIKAADHAHRAGTLTDEFVSLLTKRQGSGDTLTGYAKQWLADCRGLSEVTVEAYRDTLREFCEYLAANDKAPLLRQIQRAAIGSYLRTKRTATSTATAKQHRKVLVGFFNHAVDNERIPFNPVPSSASLKFNGRKNGTTGKNERRAFTLDEIGTIYSKAPDQFWRYMVLGGFYTALRMGDLVMMPWGAVDFKASIIRLTTRKTGTAMNIPLHARLKTLLEEIKNERGKVKPTDPIWPEQAERYETHGAGMFSNEFYDDILLPAGLVVKRSKHKAKGAAAKTSRKVNSVSFHCLRHTFVSLLKVAGGSQAVAKELAGHSSDAVSDLYTHVPQSALSEAINLLPEVTK